MTKLSNPGTPGAAIYEADPPGGLLLPPGIVQPFDLRYAADDLHVIVYFDGHPAYEAVEAMVCLRAGGVSRVRAILTRHDQTQVDHVNEHADWVAAQNLDGRATVQRAVNVEPNGSPGAPTLTVRFVSFANEQVCFSVAAAAPADARRGGLTDPGGHSATSSLPMMWRARSNIAGTGSAVTINDIRYPIKERVRLPSGFVGLNGFFTEDFRMGVIRAGTQRFEVLQEPSHIEPGSVWCHEFPDARRVRWEVTRKVGATHVIIETNDEGFHQRVSARVHGWSLAISRIEHFGSGSDQPDFILRFEPGGHFAMDIRTHQDLVTGITSVVADGDPRLRVALSPESPSWAAKRRVTVTADRDGNDVAISTVVGQAAHDSSGK